MATSSTKEPKGPSSLADFHEPGGQLDPGPQPRPRRKLGCRTILSTCGILIGIGFIVLLIFLARMFVRGVQNPHAHLYQDLKQPYRPQDVVRPLVDSNQTFDIVATVWLRSQEARKATPAGLDELGSFTWEGNVQTWGVVDLLEEDVIFSETVFKGVGLKGKASTSVKLQVPIAVFKNKNLNNYDLRGSFFLVPNSPSPLDNATGYSSWIPQHIHYPPASPLVKKFPTLADNIVNSFGTFTPLLSFHGIESRCEASSGSEISESDEVEEFGDDEEQEQQEDMVVMPNDVIKNRKKWVSTKGKPVLSAHPYVITRSFVRILDMTKVLNKQAYDNIHNRLKISSCGRLGTQRGYRAEPQWKDCVRSLHSTGTQETKIKLERKINKSGKSVAEWVYAPYLDVPKTGWGPKDLVPVPVHRESCPQQAANDTQSNALEQDYVNITWNIVFAGRTPAKFSLAEAMGGRDSDFNMTDVEHKRLAKQSLEEHLDSLVGYRHRTDYHPRFFLVLSIAADLMHYTVIVLDVLYWYTRSTTVGISIVGTTLIAAATILQLIMDIACEAAQNEEIFGVFAFAWKLFTGETSTSILALKAASRAELYWRKGWIPALSFSPATHSERASARIDSRVSHRVKAAIFLSLAFVYAATYHYWVFIINPIGYIPFKNNMARYLTKFPQYTLLPAITLGRLLQIILNFRSKTFAGMYKATSYISVLEIVFKIASRSPWIIGEAIINGPVTYFMLFELACFTTFALQSLRYRSVSTLDEDDTSSI